MNKQLYVIRYGEIALKGNNRKNFIAQLANNIKDALADLSDIEVLREHGRIFLFCAEGDRVEVECRLGRVFGIVSYSPAAICGLEIERIAAAAIAQMRKLVDARGALTFKVEARRANKQYPLKSPEIAREIGAHILRNVAGLKVDVKSPDVVCQIEVRSSAYVYTDVIAAQGGMPYKTGGKGMLLLSGGIDSPVAGYLMARRGLEIEAVHFHSFPFTGQRAHDKVITLARKLAQYTTKVRVHSVNISDIQLAIRENCPSDEMTILSRRAMMKIADRIAEQRKCKALVTGESLGQVASQTIEGINVTTDAANRPIFRPLIAMDKVDITAIAKRIDTYETSILPYEDCCTVFLPKRVVTKPRVHVIRESEARYPMEELLEAAIANMKVEIVTLEEDLSLL